MSITGRRLAFLWVRQILFQIAPFKNLDVQEAQGTNVEDNGVPRELAFTQEVSVVAADVIGSDLNTRDADVLFETFERFGV